MGRGQLISASYSICTWTATVHTVALASPAAINTLKYVFIVGLVLVKALYPITKDKGLVDYALARQFARVPPKVIVLTLLPEPAAPNVFHLHNGSIIASGANTVLAVFDAYIPITTGIVDSLANLTVILEFVTR